MINVTIYRAESGEIIKSMSLLNEKEVLKNISQGEAWIHGIYQKDGFFVSGGNAVSMPEKTSDYSVFDYTIKQWVEGEQQIGTAKVSAARELLDAISAARRRFITVTPGQEMIYLAKEAEAARYLGLTQEPESLADFPLLAAEVGITAQTAYQLAQIWMFMSSSWRAAAAQIEAIRLSAGAAIHAAQTVAETLSALDQALSALNQINP